MDSAAFYYGVAPSSPLSKYVHFVQLLRCTRNNSFVCGGGGGGGGGIGFLGISKYSKLRKL
jgi:hypothetical protein